MNYESHKVANLIAVLKTPALMREELREGSAYLLLALGKGVMVGPERGPPIPHLSAWACPVILNRSPSKNKTLGVKWIKDQKIITFSANTPNKENISATLMELNVLLKEDAFFELETLGTVAEMCRDLFCPAGRRAEGLVPAGFSPEGTMWPQLLPC